MVYASAESAPAALRGRGCSGSVRHVIRVRLHVVLRGTLNNEPTLVKGWGAVGDSYGWLLREVAPPRLSTQ